jgi:cysteine synthase
MSADTPKGLSHTSRFTESGLRVADDVLGLIAKTPLVRLSRLSPPGGATVWGKVEFVNPAGSVKDRPALSMIMAAEKSGELKAGATLVEATSGNTGISLAMIAAVRGYRCLLVMPEDMSLERRYILRAYGAEIVLTPAGDGMSGAVSKALRVLEDTPGAFMPSQFDNPANPASHEHGTALEILEQTGHSLAAFVAGVGTGGTVTGVGRALKSWAAASKCLPSSRRTARYFLASPPACTAFKAWALGSSRRLSIAA